MPFRQSVHWNSNQNYVKLSIYIVKTILEDEFSVKRSRNSFVSVSKRASKRQNYFVKMTLEDEFYVKGEPEMAPSRWASK